MTEVMVFVPASGRRPGRQPTGPDRLAECLREV